MAILMKNDWYGEFFDFPKFEIVPKITEINWKNWNLDELWDVSQKPMNSL